MDSSREQLVIDHAAAAEPPGEREVARWAGDHRVFVSSAMAGYQHYRAAAIEAIEDVGAVPVAFERFGGRDADPEAAYLSEVSTSSIYVGLLGARYGKPLADRYSATHAEYNRAEREGLRLSVWAEEGVEREGPQQSFFEAVRTFDVTGSYSTPAELKAGLVGRLKDIAAEDLSPWCKLGSLIFRAREITESPGEATIEATVHDAAVSDGLQELSDPFHRSELLLTFPGRCLKATARQIQAVTRAARTRDFRIELKVEAAPTPQAYRLNDMSWEDMTDLAIRVSLFGEPNPLGLMSGQAEIPNPFPLLALAGVAEEALRPLAQILLTEILVVHRGVQRITRFRLGRPIAGKRPLRLEWLPRRAYANEPPPEPHVVEGQVEA
jgi:uncharacterized protein DUF4062